MATELRILDIPVHSQTMEEALEAVVAAAREPGLTQVAFVNADCLNISVNHLEYRRLLQRLSMVLADGSGIRYAGKMLGTPVADNVNGTDLFPLLCERAVQEGLSMYFLGARPGVTDAMVERLLRRYPGLKVAGHRDGFFSPEEEPEVIRTIAGSGAQMLFVAFGAPRQDLWIDAHRDELGVNMAMGVGGLFDFMSERMPRAPKWMRTLGIEWVFRLLQEPGRLWRRYIIGNPLFLWRVWRWSKRRQ